MDVSNQCIAATLSQEGRLVTFWFRTLNASEEHYFPVEKEAAFILEALRDWHFYLIWKPSTLIADQQALSFIFNYKKRTIRSKNYKLNRWRVELSTYNYKIRYRLRAQNAVTDVPTKANCVAIKTDGRLMSPSVIRESHVWLISCAPKTFPTRWRTFAK